jgi:hypothetical protein
MNNLDELQNETSNETPNETPNEIAVNNISAINLFPTVIYKINASDYIDVIRKSGLEAMQKEKKLHELYPLFMSSDMLDDENIKEFCQKVIQTAFDILVDQGYDVSYRQTFFQSLWMQEHYKLSGMEEHIHNDGCYLTAFYFTDVPENSSNIVFHDPRPAKVQIDIPQKEAGMFICTPRAYLTPEAGDLIITNSWLPHSFTRHGNDEPLRFIHINIGLGFAPLEARDLPEIV